MDIKIRKATTKDFNSLYKLGLSAPELKVENDVPFMDRPEFKWHITSPDCLMLVAENKKKIVGFVCINSRSADSPRKDAVACFVYTVVDQKYRRHGIGHMLYETAESILKKRGVKYLYGWAHAKAKGILALKIEAGWKIGNNFIWSSKDL